MYTVIRWTPKGIKTNSQDTAPHDWSLKGEFVWVVYREHGKPQIDITEALRAGINPAH